MHCGRCFNECPIGCMDGDCELVEQLSLTSYSHVCATTSAGRGFCWGGNDFGQIGNGYQGAFSQEPEALWLESLGTVSEVVAGRYHSCARSPDGRVACWGANESGQAGPMDEGNQLQPQWVLQQNGEALTGVRQLALGNRVSCALLENEEVVCWGDPLGGRLGNGQLTAGAQPYPTPVLEMDGTPLGGVRSLGAGHEHLCAVLVDGGLRCWGQNRHGQLGGADDNQAHAFPVPGLTEVIQVVGGNTYTAALFADGSVRWWGSFAGERTPTPTQVSGLKDVQQISGGMFHLCAMTGGGAAFCLGDNQYGKLGDGTTVTTLQPVRVFAYPGHPLGPVSAVLAGQVHSCALLIDGSVHCWGANWNGQLGPEIGDQHPWPTPIPFVP